MNIHLRITCWLFALGMALLGNGTAPDKKVLAGMIAGMAMGLVIGSDWPWWREKFQRLQKPR